MNRTSIALAAAMLLSVAAAPAAAQTTLHVSGGLNRADVALPANLAAQFAGRKPLMAMVAGAAISFPVSGRVNLQLGADYSQEGFGATDDDGFELTVDIEYYEASALLDVALGGGGRASVNLLLGPTYSHQASCTLTVSAQGLTASDACESGFIKGPDAGVLGGLRAGIGITDSIDLTIGAFYNHGILNINDATSASDAGTVTTRTMTARAGLAYRIG